MKYGYARVSTEDQSLDLQIDALRAAGVEEGNIFLEKRSGAGTVEDRPVLESILARLESGDSLVVWTVDRLGRSAKNAAEIAEDLRSRGVALLITTLGVDTSSSVGTLVYGLLAQVAAFERDLLVERTKHGMAAARRRGKHIGRPRKLSAAQVEEAIRLRRGGRSKRSIASLFNVSISTLDRSMDLEGGRLHRGGHPSLNGGGSERQTASDGPSKHST